MKVTVHLLEFFSPCNTHTEIVLEVTHKNVKYYYGFDRWTDPEEKFIANDFDCKWGIENANRKATLVIDAHLETLIKDCKEFLNTTPGHYFKNNCGDASAWFLAKYANIQNPGPLGKPLTCNQAWCCFFVASPLQGCLPTLPGRVMDYTEYQLEQRKENGITAPPKLHMD